MQTGVISTENVAQILRNISQRRQNGSLEILQGEDKVNLVFFNGKIVDAYKESENAITRAARRLEKAGEDAGEDELRLVVKHEVLNFLFDLNLNNQSIFNFKNYMPEFDKTYAVNISVGQYLLDKASLDAESKKFNQVFSGDPVIMKLDLSGLELTEEEQKIYDSLGERQKLSRIFESSIFSRYHLVINLLSFYERAVIEVEHGDRDINLDLAPNESIVNVLEDSSERPYVEGHMKPVVNDSESKNKKESAAIDSTDIREKTEIKPKAIAKENSAASNATNRTRKYKEQDVVPQIVLGAYLVIFFALIALTWESFLSAF